MGCINSSPPVEMEQGGMSSDQCVDGVLSASKINLKIKQKMFSFSGGDFVVKDSTGNEWYKVVGKVMTMRDKMVIQDMEGNKKAVLQRQMLNVRETFQIYRYTPNQEGQESTETDDGTPIYRFAKIEKDIVSLLPCFSYYLYKGNEDGAELLRAETKFAFKFTCMFKKSGSDTVVGAVGQSSMIQFEEANSYVLELGDGMDVLGMICLSCAVDQMREKN